VARCELREGRKEVAEVVFGIFFVPVETKDDEHLVVEVLTAG
jgi:hypothetical protein